MKLKQGFFRDVPYEREVFDYGTRTDGQPVYSAYNRLAAALSDPGWVIFFYKYDSETNDLLEKYSLEGIWNDRVSLFAEYAV